MPKVMVSGSGTLYPRRLLGCDAAEVSVVTIATAEDLFPLVAGSLRTLFRAHMKNKYCRKCFYKSNGNCVSRAVVCKYDNPSWHSLRASAAPA